MLTRRGAVFGIAAAVGGTAQAAPPASGTLSVYPDLVSDFVPSRTVWVWSPPEAGRYGRLPVIYMHDGQNLFDDTLAAFGEWGVDEALTALSVGGGRGGAIVVGIANTDQRRREYLPSGYLSQIDLSVRSRIEESVGGAPQSEAYVAFLTEFLMPLIAAHHPVERQRESVFTMGSSMGGLISFEIACQRPDLFGGAACLSTHWPLRFEAYESAEALVAWQEALLPAVGRYVATAPPRGLCRLWFDYGDQNLDRWYRPYQLAADGALLERGYRRDETFESMYYPGADHNEAAWRRRLQDPLRFLLRSGA
jgi:enterochelin esterase-like enzyme